MKEDEELKKKNLKRDIELFQIFFPQEFCDPTEVPAAASGGFAVLELQALT